MWIGITYVPQKRTLFSHGLKIFKITCKFELRGIIQEFGSHWLKNFLIKHEHAWAPVVNFQKAWAQLVKIQPLVKPIVSKLLLYQAEHLSSNWLFTSLCIAGEAKSKTYNKYYIKHYVNIFLLLEGNHKLWIISQKRKIVNYPNSSIFLQPVSENQGEQSITRGWTEPVSMPLTSANE